MKLCESCGEKPQADVKDDHGKRVPYCDDCVSAMGEAQDERRREAA